MTTGVASRAGFLDQRVWAQSGPDFRHAEGAASIRRPGLRCMRSRVTGQSMPFGLRAARFSTVRCGATPSIGTPIYGAANMVFVGDDTHWAAGRSTGGH